NWEDITPKNLPKFSRVSIIDESKHKPGTLYLAANRYQVDDRQPYVFKTNDFGKTWTKIINGIEDGHFARAVREDPIRQGLLFLATEHGVYFSMNDGDLWQSLQLKLPDTPIRDLVIKDNDVVIGSHGRGFWILDDIQPLRQYKESMKNQAAVLYKPSDVIRGIQKGSIQYYLKDQMDTITFEIMDANDKLINTFTGSKPKYEEDPDLPYWLKGGSSKPTTAKGINTFSWDLRYSGATEFEGMIIWSARPQRGPKAPIGNYKVKMKIKDYEKTYPFSILMDPNLKGITEADLMEQFELANKIMQKTSMANEAVIHIRKMRNQIEENKGKVSSADYKKTMMPFLDKSSAIEQELYQVKNQSGQDPLNFPIKLNNRLASLRRSMENGEAKPTDGAYKVYEELSSELEEHLGDLNKIMSNELPKVNSILEKAGASPLEEMK
ncbi:MAG: glycosyl hydrolase, partial [Eudoraea sp.]|uniref:WD40/YVTN/BNR-like repeat-containing protein n=1 Tax=Eudoraea sp. TaxID=1979955 RepID=UPI003C713568